MVSEGTADYSMLQQMERAVNTAFSRAELRLSIFMKNTSDFLKLNATLRSSHF